MIHQKILVILKNQHFVLFLFLIFLFDFSRIGSNTCEGTHNDKKQLEVYIPRIENYNSIAFPDTTKYSFETDSRVVIFHYKVFNDIYKMPQKVKNRK